MRRLIQWARRKTLTVYVVLACAFLVLPILIVVPTAFSAGMLARFPPEGFSTRWFEYIFSRPDWVSAFFASTRVAMLTTIGSLVIGIPAAVGLVQHRVPGRRAIMLLLLGPLMFPTIVIGIALLQWLVAIGVVRSLTTLAMGHMLITTPFVVRLVSASLQGSGVLQQRAARSLGANWWRTFLHVTLPGMRSAVFGSAALAYIISMADVNVAIFISPVRLRTLPVKLFAHIEQNSDPVGAAVATVVLLLAVLALLILDRTVGLREAFASHDVDTK